jgi:hypothetical protein
VKTLRTVHQRRVHRNLQVTPTGTGLDLVSRAVCWAAVVACTATYPTGYQGNNLTCTVLVVEAWRRVSRKLTTRQGFFGGKQITSRVTAGGYDSGWTHGEVSHFVDDTFLLATTATLLLPFFGLRFLFCARSKDRN